MVARTWFISQKDRERHGEVKWRTSDDYTADQKQGTQKAQFTILNRDSLVTNKAALLSLQCT